MSSPALIVPALVCAAVLAVSGVAKLRSPQAAQDAVTALRVPAPGPLPRVLPFAELVLAAALLLVPGHAALVPAALTTLLMLAYTAVIARALRFDEPVRCHCFGELGAHTVSARTLVRNLLLVLCAAGALLAGAAGQGVPDLVADPGPDGWWWLLAAAVAAAVVALSVAPGDTSPAHGERSARRRGLPPPEDEDEAEYVRLPIPYARLHEQDGTAQTLRALAAERAVLLVSLSPGCGPCARIADDLPAWRTELDPLVAVRAVFVAGADDLAVRAAEVRALAPAAADQALYDEDGGTAQTLEMAGTPTAVLLGADGMLAGGPVAGEHAVRRLVTDMLAELHAADAFAEQAPQSEGGSS